MLSGNTFTVFADNGTLMGQQKFAPVTSWGASSKNIDRNQGVFPVFSFSLSINTIYITQIIICELITIRLVSRVKPVKAIRK